MNTTRDLITIATALLANPHDDHWAYNIHKHTGIPRITIKNTLRKLAQQGHLTAHWETPPPTGRPPRHYHHLTPTGTTHLTTLITNAHPRHKA